MFCSVKNSQEISELLVKDTNRGSSVQYAFRCLRNESCTSLHLVSMTPIICWKELFIESLSWDSSTEFITSVEITNRFNESVSRKNPGCTIRKLGIIDISLQSCNDLRSRGSFLTEYRVTSIARSNKCKLSIQSTNLGTVASWDSPLSMTNLLSTSILVQFNGRQHKCRGKVVLTEEVIHFGLQGRKTSVER